MPNKPKKNASIYPSGEEVLEELQPCKWLTTHSVGYSMLFNTIQRNGTNEFDLSILQMLTDGKLEIVPGILGESAFISTLPN